MKLIKSIYNYYFGDYWSNVYNTLLVEYYIYLIVFVGQVL